MGYFHLPSALALSLVIVPSPKLIKLPKISINMGKMEQEHSDVLLNSFPMNGHTLGFCTWSQK